MTGGAGAASEIVLLGGSGDVGSRLARLLLENTGAVVTTVSRRAMGNSLRFGDRLRHVCLDLSGGEKPAMPGSAIVVNLTEAAPSDLVRQIVASGACFLETSATPEYLQAIENALQDVSGPGRAILCVGVAPGLTNLLATEIGTERPETVQIDMGVEMGLGRHYGAAATEWFLRAAGRTYPVMIDGRLRPVAAGQLGRKFAFKENDRPRRSIGYGFVEQSVIARNAGQQLRTVRSFVALDPPWMTRVWAALLALGLGPMINRHSRKLTGWMLRMPAFGQARTRVIAEGFDEAKHLTVQIRVETGDQAEATAAMIFATIVAILERGGTGRRGVTTIADHLSLDAALAALCRFLPETRVQKTSGSKPDLQKDMGG